MRLPKPRVAFIHSHRCMLHETIRWSLPRPFWLFLVDDPFSPPRRSSSACNRALIGGALDEEAQALLRRAQPFPLSSSELSGERVDLTMPIRFNLK
jgi:hypothetical protein